jgi:hypothetical protein
MPLPPGTRLGPYEVIRATWRPGAEGAALPSIIARLAERQQERDALVAAIASAQTLQQIHVASCRPVIALSD